MSSTQNLGLTVDLPQDSTDIPTQMSADNSNFKKIDEWAGNVQKKPTAETFAISSWTAASGITPFTCKAEVTAEATIGEDSIVELVNDNAVAFAAYGFVIGAVSGQTITFYAVTQPPSAVTLTVAIGG